MSIATRWCAGCRCRLRSTPAAFRRWRSSWRRAPANVQPAFDQDGDLTFAGRRIAGSQPGTLTLNFEGGADDIPTYSLADLRACVEKGDSEFFKREFDGKIVIIGTLLNLDDRKLTSKRFATGLEGARAPRCALPPAVRGRTIQAHDHCRRLCACDRGQQSAARRRRSAS